MEDDNRGETLAVMTQLVSAALPDSVGGSDGPRKRRFQPRKLMGVNSNALGAADHCGSLPPDGGLDEHRGSLLSPNRQLGAAPWGARLGLALFGLIAVVAVAITTGAAGVAALGLVLVALTGLVAIVSVGPMGGSDDPPESATSLPGVAESTTGSPARSNSRAQTTRSAVTHPVE